MKKIRIEILVPEDDWLKAVEQAKKQGFSLKKELQKCIKNTGDGIRVHGFISKEFLRRKREPTWCKEIFPEYIDDKEGFQGWRLEDMDGKNWLTQDEFLKKYIDFG